MCSILSRECVSNLLDSIKRNILLSITDSKVDINLKMKKTERGKDYYLNLLKFAGWALLVVSLILYFGIPILQVYLAMHPPNIRDKVPSIGK